MSKVGKFTVTSKNNYLEDDGESLYRQFQILLNWQKFGKNIIVKQCFFLYFPLSYLVFLKAIYHAENNLEECALCSTRRVPMPGGEGNRPVDRPSAFS